MQEARIFQTPLQCPGEIQTPPHCPGEIQTPPQCPPEIQTPPQCPAEIQTLLQCPGETGSQRTVPRKMFSLEPQLVILGSEYDEARRLQLEEERFWQFSEKDKTWSELTTLPEAGFVGTYGGDNSLFSVCSTERGLVLTGGVKDGDVSGYVTTDECWLFDSIFQKWIAMPRMKQARTRHTSVAHRGVVYVIGGSYRGPVESLNLCESDGDAFVDYCDVEMVECLDPRKRVWEELATPTPCNWEYSPPVVATHGDCIYVFGAETTHQYDTTTREWSNKADIPVSGAPEGGCPLCSFTAQNVAALAPIPLPLFCAEMNYLHCHMHCYIRISIGKNKCCQ